MQRSVLLAVGAGILSVLPMALALNIPGGVFLTFFSPLPLFLTGLGLGSLSAFVAGAAAVVVWAFFAGPSSAVSILLIMAAPAWILTRQAMLSREAQDGSTEWYPCGFLVLWLTAIGAVCVVVFAVFIASLAETGQGLAGNLSAMMTDALVVMLPDLDPETAKVAAAGFAANALALISISWMLLLAVNGALAQRILVRTGRNLRPSPDLAHLELPVWVPAGPVVALLAGMLLGGDAAYVARNVGIVLCLPLFFLGLATVHYFSRRFAARGVLLVALYVAVVILPWIAAALTILGLVDLLAGLRRRFTAGSSGQENE